MDFSDPKYVLMMKLWTMDTKLDENTRFMEHALLLLPVYEQERDEKIISLKLVVTHLISLAIQDADTVRVHRRVLHFIMDNVDYFETSIDRLHVWTWILGVLRGRLGAEFSYEKVANHCRNRMAQLYEKHRLWRKARYMKTIMTFVNTETCQTDVLNHFTVSVDIAFYSLLVSDFDTFEVYIKRAMSLKKPFMDSAHCLSYDYLVGQYMDMRLHFADAATRFLQLARCPNILSTNYHLMVLAIVNIVLTPNLNMRYTLLDLFVKVNNWWKIREINGMIPFLAKVLRGVQIFKSDLEVERQLHNYIRDD